MVALIAVLILVVPIVYFVIWCICSEERTTAQRIGAMICRVSFVAFLVIVCVGPIFIFLSDARRSNADYSSVDAAIDEVGIDGLLDVVKNELGVYGLLDEVEEEIGIYGILEDVQANLGSEEILEFIIDDMSLNGVLGYIDKRK